MRARAAAALIAAAALLALAPAANAAAPRDLTSAVNPLAGTLGPGFPMVAAGRPFGMIEPGPDTALAGGAPDPANYDGYAYGDQTIRGFSLTHFDGAGVRIAGDLPFMPTTGAVSSTDPASYASTFSHAAERAEPGYYSVTLASYATRVDLTSSERAAMLRTTYPATGQANMIVNPSASIGGTDAGSMTIVDDHTIEGWTRSSVGYKLYFSAHFDQPFAGYGAWHGTTITPGARSGDGGFVSFAPAAARAVNMSVAISYVDAPGARANLARELPPGTSFDGARSAARAAWNARLNDVEVTGGDAPTFYTNLYRSLLMPSLFDDADGRYTGFDGQVHRVAAGTHHYTSLSLWDTYRTQTPLLDLIEPHVAHDVAVSLLDDYDQNGRALPRWTQAAIDRGIMGGDSATPTLADAVAQHVLDRSESARAYAAMLHQAVTLPPAWAREHLDTYLQHGFIGNDVTGIGAAQTQEYAIDDAALAAVAHRYGTAADANALARRGGSWRNLLDPASRYIRPRNSDGSWANPTAAGPASIPWTPDFQDGYQEGTGWQYLWSEPQDVAGLVTAIGGHDETIARLDKFFTTPLQQPTVTAVPTAQQYGSFFGIYYIGDQYTPANEPDLWSPWYYDWLGQPWKTQKVVRAEMGTYNARPDGLPGNDDTGTMSAWYVLAALGIYHATPGVPAWQLSSPSFDSATVRTGAGLAFHIDAPGASDATPYVSAATLGGVPLARTYLSTCELRSGAHLTVTPAAQPNTAWGTGAGAAPPSASDAATAPPIRACG